MEFDTICAISTSLAGSAINIIRVSGDEAIPIVNSILSSCDLTKKKRNTINHAYIKNDDGSIIDEVLVSLFIKPYSYTKEDLVEINTHGGIYITNKVLELLLKKGCRMAEAGEFTKRAFINGRIDLTQAEAVMDLISSKSDSSLILSNRALRGDVFKLISSLRKEIEELLLHITVNIDYPEYIDELQVTNELINNKTKELINFLDNIISKSETLRVYKEGIKTVILGKPNVGKSSLLNALLNEEKAIVTSVSGTTRDIIEGDVNIGGIILHLLDTAGIRETNDEVEKIGIKRSINALEEAELVLLVLDESNELKDEDKELLNITNNKNRIIIGNKSDIASNKLDIDRISISALNKDGIDTLKSKIRELFIKEDVKLDDEVSISSTRHIALLKRAKQSLENALNSSLNNEFIDMVDIDLREAYNILGEIIGDNNPEELINELFKKFCLGK